MPTPRNRPFLRSQYPSSPTPAHAPQSPTATSTWNASMPLSLGAFSLNSWQAMQTALSKATQATQGIFAQLNIAKFTIGVEAEFAINLLEITLADIETAAFNAGCSTTADDSIQLPNTSHQNKLLYGIETQSKILSTLDDVIQHSNFQHWLNRYKWLNDTMAEHVHIGINNLDLSNFGLTPGHQVELLKSFIYVFVSTYQAGVALKSQTKSDGYSKLNAIFYIGSNDALIQKLNTLGTIKKLTGYINPRSGNNQSVSNQSRQYMLNLDALAKHGTIEIRGLSSLASKSIAVELTQKTFNNLNPHLANQHLHALKILQACKYMMGIALKNLQAYEQATQIGITTTSYYNLASIQDSITGTNTIMAMDNQEALTNAPMLQHLWQAA